MLGFRRNRATFKQTPTNQNDNRRALLRLEQMEDRVVPVAGVTVNVTTLNDVVDATDGVISLREAIQDLNTQAANTQHTITFAANLNGGTISLNSQLNALEKNISINGPGSNNLTVSRNAAMADFRLFEVKGTSTSTIAGLTLTNGKASGIQSGGAILAGGILTVSGCSIHGNSALYGGGIATIAKESGGTEKSVLTLLDTVIENNDASYGGGLLVTDANVTANSSVVIQENTANLVGGGIYIRKVNAVSALIVELSGATVSANTAAFTGGGIHLLDGDLQLDGALICCNNAVNNFSEATRGGGVFAADGTNVIATNNPTIASNEAMTGDGLYLAAGAARTGTVIYVEDSEYDGNSA